MVSATFNGLNNSGANNNAVGLERKISYSITYILNSSNNVMHVGMTNNSMANLARKVSFNAACYLNNSNNAAHIIDDSERIVNYNNVVDSVRKAGCNAACTINNLVSTSYNDLNDLANSNAVNLTRKIVATHHVLLMI